jgi:hypothetical protein
MISLQGREKRVAPWGAVLGATSRRRQPAPPQGVNKAWHQQLVNLGSPQVVAIAGSFYQMEWSHKKFAVLFDSFATLT